MLSSCLSTSPVLASVVDFGACLAFRWRRGIRGIGRFWEGGRLGILKDIEGKNRRQHQEQAESHDDLDLIGFPLITWNTEHDQNRDIKTNGVCSQGSEVKLIVFSILGWDTHARKNWPKKKGEAKRSIE